VAYSPDGSRLATASGDHKVKVWDAKSGTELATLRGHTVSVTSVAYSPDGSCLATASYDQTVKVWDAKSSTNVATLQGHRAPVTSVSYSSDGSRILSTDLTGQSLVWEAAAGKLLPDEKPPPHLTNSNLSPEGKHVAIPDGTVIHIRLRRSPPEADLWAEDWQRRQVQVPRWHAEQAAAALMRGDAFAAAFHRRRLAEGDNLRLLAWAQLAAGDQEACLLTIAGLRKERQGLAARWQVSATLASTLAVRPVLGSGLGPLAVSAAARQEERRRAAALVRAAALLPDSGINIAELLTLARACVAGDPQSGPCRELLGAALYRDGKPAEAIQELDEAAKLHGDGGSLWTRLFLALAHQRLGHTQEAADWHKKADKAGPWEEQVMQFHLLGELEQTPRDAGTWKHRGDAYPQLGQHDKAIADYSKAIELDPKLAMAWNNRGTCYSQLGQHEKAIADYSRAIELDPKLVNAWNNRGTSSSQLGQHAKAVADYSTAIELDPRDVQLWYQRGVLYCDRLLQPAKAVSDFSKAIELNPRDAETWKYRGDAYSQLGQHDKAIADYSRAIELDPKLVNAWNNRGTCYSQLGQHDKAIADYSRAIDLNPMYVTCRFNRGVAYAQVGQHEKAVEDFSRVIELSPKGIGGWAYRGNAHLALGNHDKAVADFSEVIKLDAKVGLAWFRRGIAHNGLAHFPEAVADYRKALTLLPADAGIHDALARLLATCLEPKLRDPAEAVKLAKKAIELSHGHINYWNTLGMAQYRAGDGKAAIAAFDRYLEINKGGHASLWLFRAMSHRKLGNETEARKCYDRATQWLKKNEKALATDRAQAEELRRFRSEAEDVLELKNK
jgi:tetratricopeptide (TPR) repeat protein